MERLTAEECEAVYAEALSIVETGDMRMHGAGVLSLRRESGAFVEEARGPVRLPADLVADAVAGCPAPSRWRVANRHHEIGAATDGIWAELEERAERGLYMGDEQRGAPADDCRVTTEDIRCLS